MGILKNNQHEKFCRELISGKNQREAAVAAGFKPRHAKQRAHVLTARPDVQARLQELNEEANSECIMSVLDRKLQLSEIARGRLADFMCIVNGKLELMIASRPLHSAALQSATTKTTPGSDREKPVTNINIKLNNPIKAIAELNRMEGIGSWKTETNPPQAYIPIKEIVIRECAREEPDKE
jgi:hypothetical protein